MALGLDTLFFSSVHLRELLRLRADVDFVCKALFYSFVLFFMSSDIMR